MHPTETQLNDYVDNALDVQDASIIADHLASCDECRREIAAIIALEQRLAELPAAVAPERDLRSGIWQQVEAAETARPRARKTLWSARYLLAAAAVVLVVASSAITRLLVKQPDPYSIAARPAAVPTLVNTSAHALEQQYADEVADLQAVLKKSRGTLAPATVRILEDNLKIIDNAIREARAALAADPNSAMLIDLLRSAYERKLELLRQAAKSSAT
ncbi:MAG TPA: zf-HC2 domain-containing protein [Longimicrobiales bacterium]